MTNGSERSGRDLVHGISVNEVPDGHMPAGRVRTEPVLLTQSGGEFFAIGATFTHYGGPLVDGLIVGETVRCPWHHACFSLQTGEALRAPALSPVACWSLERRGDKIYVQNKKQIREPERSPLATSSSASPDKIVIIGGGAAGFGAAEKLRREQWQGNIVMLSDDDDPPVDRPNLSKDYLAGSASEDWIPLRPDNFYSENGIELRLKANVMGIDVREKDVTLANGQKSPMIGYYSRPAPSRSTCLSRERIGLTYACCARLQTAAQLSSLQPRHAW